MKLPAEMNASQIAQLIGGRVAGADNVKVSGFSESPLQAGDGDIAMVFDQKLLKKLDACKASIVVVPEGTEADRPMILVKRPTLAIQKILSYFKLKRFYPESGIHPTAVVDATAKLGEKVAVGPHVVIGPETVVGDRTILMAGTVLGGKVQIGTDCVLRAGCLIADYVRIGNRVSIEQGASIGSDGFGYVTERPSNMENKRDGINEYSDEPNPLLKIPQNGTVVIEDDVEIGANTTIDRATMGATVIGAGSKIDNLVMIAHNCKIGREAIIIAQTAVAGSCTVGDRSIIAGHVGVKDHVNLGKDSICEGMAGVMKDVPPGEVVSGIPAIPARDYFTNYALMKKLPKMKDELKSLQERVKQLEKLVESK